MGESPAFGVIPGVLEEWLAAHGGELIRWRREIHRHPELSWRETRTTALAEDLLRGFGLDPRPLPGTGLVVDLGPDQGPRIALRADLDALPLTENSGLPFASDVEGVAHACGHDMHTAILLGTAAVLAEAQRRAPLPVGVRLIFQPAEEVMPGGALEIVALDVLDDVERAFALHCDPKIEVGKVGSRVGPITSAGDRMELVVHSGGGHTSRPHLTADVVHALASVVTTVPGIVSRRVDPRSGSVVVFGSIHAGDAANAIPRTGILRGTARTGTHETWVRMEPLIRETIDHVLAPTGVRYELDYVRGVPPVVNDAHAVEVFTRAVVDMDANALTDTPQSVGGEDFAWYLEKVPGALVRLGTWDGVGEQGDLHQPDIVFDERALAVGVRVFCGVVDNYRHVAGG